MLEGRAIFIVHTEDDCPLLQDGPERAEELAAALDPLDLVGVFLPKRHRGVIIDEGDQDPEELAKIYEQTLPYHTAEVKRIDLGPFTDWLEDPSLLADREQRDAFLREAAKVFKNHELEPSSGPGGETQPLADLANFLHENAPQK